MVRGRITPTFGRTTFLGKKQSTRHCACQSAAGVGVHSAHGSKDHKYTCESPTAFPAVSWPVPRLATRRLRCGWYTFWRHADQSQSANPAFNDIPGQSAALSIKCIVFSLFVDCTAHMQPKLRVSGSSCKAGRPVGQLQWAARQVAEGSTPQNVIGCAFVV